MFAVYSTYHCSSNAAHQRVESAQDYTFTRQHYHHANPHKSISSIPDLRRFSLLPLIPTPARLDRRENDENGQCPIYTSEWGYHRPGRASAKPAAARHCFLSHQHRHHQCHPALLKWFLFWTWSATQGFLEADSGTEAPWCGQLCLGETKTEADGSVSVCFQSSYEIG